MNEYTVPVNKLHEFATVIGAIHGIQENHGMCSRNTANLLDQALTAVVISNTVEGEMGEYLQACKRKKEQSERHYRRVVQNIGVLSRMQRVYALGLAEDGLQLPRARQHMWRSFQNSLFVGMGLRELKSVLRRWAHACVACAVREWAERVARRVARRACNKARMRRSYWRLQEVFPLNGAVVCKGLRSEGARTVLNAWKRVCL